jgi:hypothetical protein
MTTWTVKSFNNGLSIMEGNKAIANIVMQLDDSEREKANLICQAVNAYQVKKEMDRLNETTYTKVPDESR